MFFSNPSKALSRVRIVNKTKFWTLYATWWTIYALNYTIFSPPYSDVKCLLCGVKQAIQEVLRSNMAGAHLILMTRGSTDTLSLSDEQTIQDYVKYYHIKVCLK